MMPRSLRQLRLATFVALRIVRSRRSPTLSLVTLISVVGIACGVMALSVVLSVTAGFEHTFQDRILGIFPHLVVAPERSRFENYEPVLESIRATPGVTGATPITTDSMMVANGIFRAGATIQGVEPASVGGVLDLERLMKSGDLAGLEEAPTFAWDGDTLTVGGVVEGVWMTVVLRDGEGGRPRADALFDDRVVPDAGRSRVKVLDLRRAPSARPGLLPRGGDAVDRFELTDREDLGPRVDAAPGALAWGRERELPGGDWELDATGDRILFEADALVTITLLDGDDGRPESRVALEPAEGQHVEKTAHVRVIDARSAGGALTVSGVGRAAPLAITEPGEFTEFTATPARLPGILLGSALAARLRASVGDDLTLVTPLRGIDNKMMGPFGMLPSSSHFEVAGIFEAGFHEHDSKLALINFEVAQRFLNRGRIIHSIAVRTEDVLDVDAAKLRVSRAIDPFEVPELITNTESLRDRLGVLVQPGFSSRRADESETFIGGLRNVTEAVNLLKFQRSETARRARFRIFDWKEKNKFMFGALELQKVVLTMFFLIIIVVGSFVVVGSQIMIIHEKTADIAILKAMGARDRLVRLVFTLQGLFVALAGALVGLAAGLAMIAVIDAVDYELDAAIYLIDHLPARVDPLELVLVVVGALVCTLVTTQISAGRAANKTVVEGLRKVD